MLRHVATLFTCLYLLIIPLAHSESVPKTTPSQALEVNNWIANYYQHPQPDLTGKMIQQLIKLNAFSQPTAAHPITIFLSQIFRQNPDKIADWLKDISTLNPDDQTALISAVWQANVPAGDAYLKSLAQGQTELAKLATTVQQSPRPAILTKVIDTPTVLDELWASYFATGNADYVKRIISTLDQTDPLGQKGTDITTTDIDQALILGAAQWSLASNAYQSPDVLKICETRLKTAKGPEKQHLITIIRIVRQRQATDGKENKTTD